MARHGCGGGGGLDGAVAPPADPRLVLYTEPRRDSQQFTDFDIGQLWQPHFATAELSGAAADLLPAIAELPGAVAEGPRWQTGRATRRSRDVAEQRARISARRRLRHPRAEYGHGTSALGADDQP